MRISRVAVLLLVTVLASTPGSADAATTVSVRDFGAAGDGTIDDTPAIQRAIDAVGDAGVIFFPPGSYRVTQLRVGSRIALVGAAPGAVTLRNTAPAGRNFSGIVTSAAAAGGVTDVEIRNLTFDRTIETDAFDEHIYLENCRRVVIENSRFVGADQPSTSRPEGRAPAGMPGRAHPQQRLRGHPGQRPRPELARRGHGGRTPRGERQRVLAHLGRSRLPAHRDAERRHHRRQRLSRPGARRPGRRTGSRRAPPTVSPSPGSRSPPTASGDSAV